MTTPLHTNAQPASHSAASVAANGLAKARKPPASDSKPATNHKNQPLARLLEQKDFHAISTKEIITAAQINRNTFYKYYRSKTDLAAQLAGDIKQEYQRVIREFFRRDFSRHDAEADRVLFGKRRLILALWQINTRRCRLYQDMLDISEQCFIEHVLARYPAEKTKDWHYQARMFAGIVLASTAYYFRQNLPLPTNAALLELKEMTAVLCKERK